MKDTKPSATALFVANGMYYNIHQSNLEKEIPEDLKRSTVQLVEHIYGMQSAWAKKSHLFKCRLSQLFSVKGFYLHFLVRKKCIESYVRGCLEQDFEQVLILGAGYDTLCTRLADEYPQIKFIELDHPSTAENKINLFRELKWNKNNIEYLFLDIKNINALFDSNKIDNGLRTVFVCEGVTMYLSKDDIGQMLEFLHDRFQKDCRFIFTFMNEDEPGDYMFKGPSLFLRLFLKLNGEPFTWGIDPDNLNMVLDHYGWDLMDAIEHTKLKAAFLSNENQNLPIAIGEQIAICEKQRK